jgi:hypothetical protein
VRSSGGFGFSATVVGVLCVFVTSA